MKIIHIDHLDRTINLVRECQATQAIGIAVGLNGSGKTSTLRYIERKYSSFGFGGKCLYHRCCQTSGPTRGVRDILIALGRKDLTFRSGVSLQLLIQQALAILKKRDIRLLLLDEADMWSRETLNGVIALSDVCIENGHVLTLILAGVKPVNLWIGGAGISRTLRVETFDNLSVEHALAVLCKWGIPFEKFVKKISRGDAEAIRFAKLIHKNTGGNLRRMKFFAELFLMSHQVVDANSVTQTFEKLLYEKS